MSSARAQTAACVVGGVLGLALVVLLCMLMRKKRMYKSDDSHVLRQTFLGQSFVVSIQSVCLRILMYRHMSYCSVVDIYLIVSFLHRHAILVKYAMRIVQFVVSHEGPWP